MPIADDDDAAANLLERRWFAASAAMNAMQGECELLREVMEIAEDAWRHARAQLAELETLRDGLGKQLNDLIGAQDAAPPMAERVLSAA